MSLFAVLTFDLKRAESEDYVYVSEGLASLGLHPQIEGKTGLAQLPENTFAGEFEGSSSTELRDSLLPEVEAVFRRCGVAGPLFLAVSGSAWTWQTHRVRPQ